MPQTLHTKKSLVLAGASLQLIALASRKGSEMLREKGKEALNSASKVQPQMHKTAAA